MVVVIVILLLVVGKSSGSTATPTDAAKTLLNAAKSGDTTAATNALCSEDRAIASAAKDNLFTGSDDRVTSYQIGSVDQTDSTHASVNVTVTTSSDSSPQTESLPVEKQGGNWKVCFSSSFLGGGSAAGGLPTSLPSGLLSSLANSLPTDVPTDLPTDLSSAISGLCADSDSGVIVASAYVGLAETGQSDAAQACVYKNTVPLSTTQKLSGKSLIPSGVDPSGGSVTLTSSDGSKVVVKTTKESDGNYYVTSVSFG